VGSEQNALEPSALGAQRQYDLTIEIETLCEAFYYFAWRFREILHDNAFGFRNYTPRGICSVRNDLIEHPKALNPNFSWGATMPEGPFSSTIRDSM